MKHHAFAALLSAVAFIQPAFSDTVQFNSGQGDARNVTVRVSFANGGSCDSRIQVSLASDHGAALNGFSNHECMVEFSNVPSGNYHVSVYGAGIQNGDGGSIAVQSDTSQELEVRVNSGPSNVPPAATAPMVAAVDLKIPDRARKEFDKATEMIAKQDLKHAIERLDRAIAIYPSYTEAYNNLAIAYIRLDDKARGHDALEKALSINDHFAPAYVNLARMSISKQDFGTAETLLEKATAIDPTDAVTMVLLADAQLMNRRYDQALATCRKAHSSAQPHASVHYIAARALEAEHKATEAIAELETFLTEEKDGPRAETARKEMAGLKLAIR